MSEPRPQLDYATAPPFGRRRAIRRAAAAAAAVALLVVGYYVLKPIPGRVRMMALQRGAAAVAYPPTQVAWEEDPARIAAWTGGAASGPDWAPLRDDGGRVRAIYLVPPGLRGLPGLVGRPSSAVYAGVRDGGAGARIVAVSLTNRISNPEGTQPAVGLGAARMLQPATLTTDAQFRTWAWNDHYALNEIPVGQLRLYWGQSDPADAAHFTIRYESPAAAGTIDGRLLPNDYVQLTVVPGPATAPSR
jgi:hypothetical protein